MRCLPTPPSQLGQGGWGYSPLQPFRPLLGEVPAHTLGGEISEAWVACWVK